MDPVLMGTTEYLHISIAEGSKLGSLRWFTQPRSYSSIKINEVSSMALGVLHIASLFVFRRASSASPMERDVLEFRISKLFGQMTRARVSGQREGGRSSQVFLPSMDGAVDWSSFGRRRHRAMKYLATSSISWLNESGSINWLFMHLKCCMSFYVL